MTYSVDIANELRPGLHAVFGSYKFDKGQFREIYKEYKSDKNFEQEVEMKMLGYAAIRGEGAPTQFDDMAQRSLFTYVNQTIALGYSITMEAQEDNLYKDRFPLMVTSLKNSVDQTKDVLGANPLNNGFTTYLIGDGQPLFSTAHPIDVGTVANTPATAIDLNEASLEVAINVIRKFKDVAGLITSTQAEKLVVPTEGNWTASRLLNSKFRVGTPNNDINAVNFEDAIPKGFVTNQFLQMPYSWYVLTNAVEGAKYFVRKPLVTDVYCDFNTDMLLIKGVERYCFGFSNFRSIYASPGV